MTNRYYDPARMYEITAISSDHIWAPKHSNDLTPIGAIIQPEPRDSWDITRQLSWRVIRPALCSTNYPAKNTRISMFGEGLRLRPLTQKEMEKLNAKAS